MRRVSMITEKRINKLVEVGSEYGRILSRILNTTMGSFHVLSIKDGMKNDIEIPNAINILLPMLYREVANNLGEKYPIEFVYEATNNGCMIHISDFNFLVKSIFMDTKIYTIDIVDLWKLCVENNYFTLGTTAEYDLFLNKYSVLPLTPDKLTTLINEILINSDTELSRGEIKERLIAKCDYYNL